MENIIEHEVNMYQTTKRIMDVVIVLAASPAIILMSLLVALLIRLTMGRPVLFNHERLGRDGKIFKLWKFRTMVKDADKKLHNYLENNPEAKKEWEENFKLVDDPRVTTLGHILRRTSVDELPQFWNVLKGEMSLVGPRPIVPREIAKYGENEKMYLSVLPGITGLWQVSGRSDLGYEDRVKLDLKYIRNMSLFQDLKILVKTVLEVIRRSGAY